MNKQEVKFIDCPICGKEFSAAVIESHASKCLFLNASNNEGSSKRSFDLKLKSPIAKKAKQESSSKSLQTKLEESNITSSPKTSDKHVQNKDTKSQFKDNIPLAERMRPSNLMSYIGQSHILGPQSILYQLLNKTEIPNIILWGPPGCGKTSLANVIANVCKSSPVKKYRFVKLSAAMSGVNEVKEAINIANNDLKFGHRTVMFMDEIHRFNKLQQDIFLPHVESGTIKLIGATTENPSFSLNSALLSRCRVIILEKLTSEDIISILEKAIRTLDGSIHNKTNKDQENLESSKLFYIDKETVRWLAETSDGDARIALGGLELAISSINVSDKELLPKNNNFISLEHVKDSLKKTHMLYDRRGDQHYDIISALHKSVRASDENASLYWLTRMITSGEDPIYIARRLVRMASEDIGLADPKALGLAVQTMQGCKMLGMPECDVLLAQCTTYLARAPKSRLMEDALRAAQKLISEQKGPQPSVPLHLRNAPTKLMNDIGYGKGYNMLHKDKSNLKYLPEGLEDIDFFKEN